MTTIDNTTAAQGLLLAHFETIADAPGGVARLRRLILQLAVQGRLVKQDWSDEPASALLERIRRQSKASESDESGDVELKTNDDIPHNWVMTRIGDVTEIVRGITFPASAKFKHQVNGSVPCLRTSNVQEEIDWEDLIYVPREYVKRSDQWVKEGDIVISMANSKELVGKVALVKRDVQDVSFGGFLAAIRAIEADPNFLCLALRSPEILAKIRRTSSQTVNIANISLGGLRPILIPLPPLAEQRSIVARVDALMALCDALEERQARQGEERRRLLGALIEALFAARDAGEAAAAWARLSESFDLVLDAPEDVAPLRQAVLQFASIGLLSSLWRQENPEQYVNSSRIAEISKMRQHLYLEKCKEAEAQKRRKPRLPVNLDEKLQISRLELFPELPPSWSYVPLGFIAETDSDAIVDGPFGTAINVREDYIPSGVPVVKINNVKPFKFIESDLRYISVAKFSELERHNIIPGDVLLTKVGTIGDSCIFPNEFPRAILSTTGSCRIRVDRRVVDNRFVCLFLNSIKPRLNIIASEGVQPFLNMKTIKSLPFPLPPLAEQEYIIEQVGLLMQKCDDLGIRFREGRVAAERLAETLCAAVAGTAMRDEAEPGAQEAAPAEGEAEAAPTVPKSPELAGPVPPLLVTGEGQGLRAKAPAATRGNGHANGAVNENDAHQAAAALLAERGTLTNGELQAALGIDGATARALLKGLVAARLATVEGQKRGTRYVWRR